MRYFSRPNSGLIAALVTLAVVGAGIVAGGGRMFSPGGLSTENRRGTRLGGVSSHAELGGTCSACHAGPMSGETMAVRCLTCHEDVKEQMDGHQPLHGALSDGMTCGACHTEHNGPHGGLTSLDRFDHDLAAFKLTGRHKSVDCSACHKDNAFKGTPRSCVSCHAEPAKHKGKFGTRCVECHSMTTWKEATFKHTFPITHGGRRKGNACSTCHQDATDYKQYTCYGCHAHTPEKIARKHRRIANLSNCVRCHPTGREKERGRDRERERGRRAQLMEEVPIDERCCAVLDGVREGTATCSIP